MTTGALGKAYRRAQSRACAAAFNAKPSTYHCSTCQAPISRYSRGQCRSCGYIGMKRGIPDDFLPILRCLGSQGAAKYYRASLATVTRWRRELDLCPQARMKKKGIGQSRTDRGFIQRPLLYIRDHSAAGQAADFLRRYSSVYRCDATGTPNAKGTHWRRRHSILTDEHIVEIATKLGWQPIAGETMQATAAQDPKYVSFSELCEPGRYSPAVVRAMAVRGMVTPVLLGSNWVAPIDGYDKNISAAYLPATDVDEMERVVALGWEPTRPSNSRCVILTGGRRNIEGR